MDPDLLRQRIGTDGRRSDHATQHAGLECGTVLRHDTTHVATPRDDVRCDRSNYCGRTTSILTPGVDIEVSEAPKKISDGYTVMAKVLIGDGDEEAADGVRRMIFAEGSAGAKQIKGATIGDHFTVLGIPRINLHKVLDLVAKHGTEEFSAQLPHEMIVMGMK